MRFDEALEAIERALALDPAHAEARDLRMFTLYKLKRRKDLDQAFETAMADDPEDAYLRFLKGTVLLERGRTRDAAEHLTEAVRLDPTHEVAARRLRVARNAIRLRGGFGLTRGELVLALIMTTILVTAAIMALRPEAHRNVGGPPVSVSIPRVSIPPFTLVAPQMPEFAVPAGWQADLPGPCAQRSVPACRVARRLTGPDGAELEVLQLGGGLVFGPPGPVTGPLGGLTRTAAYGRLASGLLASTGEEVRVGASKPWPDVGREPADLLELTSTNGGTTRAGRDVVTGRDGTTWVIRLRTRPEHVARDLATLRRVTATWGWP
jgi:hypothetical protein